MTMKMWNDVSLIEVRENIREREEVGHGRTVQELARHHNMIMRGGERGRGEGAGGRPNAPRGQKKERMSCIHPTSVARARNGGRENLFLSIVPVRLGLQ